MSKKTTSIFPFKLLWLVLSLIIFAGCEKENNNPEPEPETQPASLTVTVNPDKTYQTIAGFGGANKIWGTQFLKQDVIKKAFGTDETDLGLTIFRVRLASDSTEWKYLLESAKEVQKYDAKILASPWSPPAILKDNNNIVGGRLLSGSYDAFKNYITSFVTYMAANGVNIHVVSIQNEPDIKVSYESCDWTSSEMIDFLKNYGHLINNTKVAAPESYNFGNTFTNDILNNADAANNFDIVAGHIYGGGLGTFPLAEQKGKEIWMTEYLLNLNTGKTGAAPWSSYTESAKWDESLTMLHTIHEAMKNNWSAYVWWYIQRYYSFIGDGEQGTTNGEILKRGYAFSQFSKYVRPGYIRVDATSSKANNLEITAYKGGEQIVVVIINPETTQVNNLNIAVPSVVNSVSAYETSVSLNRTVKETQLSDGKVILNVSPKSIVTVVIK